MKILMVNGSPKRKGGASRFFLKFLRAFLGICKTEYASLDNTKAQEDMLHKLEKADTVVLSVPLYVDGIPAHILEFLEQLEKMCKDGKYHFTIYVISNNGFIEGRQNRIHLQMYQCFCERAGVKWGGGIGVGGGVMCHVLSLIYPSVIFVLLVLQFIQILAGNRVLPSDFWPIGKQVLIYLFLNCGLIYCMVCLAIGIRKKRMIKNRYTRVMIPSFVFIPFADAFMILSALCKGKTFFSLYKKEKYHGGTNE